MDNFIEDSIDYLFFNGGFDLVTGYQVFQFRVRKDGEIEVTSINNHIKTVFKGEPDIYQFFAFLIFCDMYSSKQKTTLVVCRDRDVSINNLRALNRVYNIYQTMLTMSGEDLAAALSDEEDPGALDRIMLDSSYDVIPHKQSNLEFSAIKASVESDACYFANRYEYYDNLYQEMITTDPENPFYEFLLMRWEELNNDIDADHSKFFSKEETLRILFERTNKLEDDLGLEIEGGEVKKHYILDILMGLNDDGVDVADLIYLVKCAFSSCAMEDREYVTLGDFMEAIEVCYLPDDKKDRLLSQLRNASKVVTPANIVRFPGTI